ncbi:hypothetical protein ACFL09_04035 [Planctomycetota bacterium]
MATADVSKGLVEACAELVSEVDLDRLAALLGEQGRDGWALAVSKFAGALKSHVPWPAAGFALHNVRKARRKAGEN